MVKTKCEILNYLKDLDEYQLKMVLAFLKELLD